MPDRHTSIYSLETFQKEVERLRDDDSSEELQPPLLHEELHTQLNKFVKANSGTNPKKLINEFKKMRPTNFIQQIDTEADAYAKEICAFKDAQDSDQQVEKPELSNIKSYTQRLQDFCADSPLMSLKESSRWYFKRCFPNQNRGRAKPRDVQLAHLPLPADTDILLEVAVSYASKHSVDSIFLVSPSTPLIALRDSFQCINVSSSLPIARNIGTGADPIEFFYINGFFYTDPFPPTLETIEYIYEAMRKVDPEIEADGLLDHIFPLQETAVGELNLQCDAAAGIYSHFGTICTHYIAFRDCFTDVHRWMKPSKKLEGTPSHSPMCIYRRRRTPTVCDACRALPATTLRYFDVNVPYHPTLLCHFCHTRLQEDYLPSEHAIVIKRDAGEYSGV